MEVGDRLLAVLSSDVGGDVVHRAGSIQRDHGREVVDRGRAEVANVAAHPRRLELEDAGGLAGGEQLERLRVVERDRVEVDLDAAMLAHEVDCLAEDRQVRQAEEVELEEPQGLDGVHLVLAHEPVRVGRLLKGHQLGQRLAADDDAGRVGRGVPCDALEVASEVGDPPDRRVAIDESAELGRHRDRLVEADPELVRDRLRDPVDLAVAVAEHATHVANGRAREHRAERDDLGDVVLAVLAADVGDDLFTPAVLEVHVDIGHRHAVGVEEPLERELVEDRVDRRDAERVRHDRARGAAAARRLDPLLAGERDEVGDDQEVAGVAHRQDDPELVVEACLELRRDRPVPAFEAALALLAEPRFGRMAIGHREMRDPQLAERQGQVGHLGDPAGVQDRVWLIGEERRHLGRRLDVEVVRVEAHPVRRVEVVAGPDAQQDVVGLGLVLADVMEVVGHDERQPGLGREPQQLLVEPPLVGHPVILELEVEAVLAEDVAVLAGEPAGQLPVLDLERLWDLAGQARRQPDQAFAVTGQMLAIDPRLVVVAVDVGIGHEPAQVAVAGEVLGEEDQVEGLRIGLALLVASSTGGRRTSRRR